MASTMAAHFLFKESKTVKMDTKFIIRDIVQPMGEHA